MLDTGRDVIQLTVEDKSTRGIGDFDLAEEDDVPISLPLLTQVKVPTSGGRIILASSGAWSAFHSARGQQITRSTVRSWSTEVCTAWPWLPELAEFLQCKWDCLCCWHVLGITDAQAACNWMTAVCSGCLLVC